LVVGDGAGDDPGQEGWAVLVGEYSLEVVNDFALWYFSVEFDES